MTKLLLASCAAFALTFGSIAMAMPGLGGPGGGGGPSCTDLCAPSISLPGGTFCFLDGCLIAGDAAFCNYICFFALPF